MKESQKRSIAVTLSSAIGLFAGMLSLTKLPNFDKDLDDTRLFKSRKDAADVIGKNMLSLGVEASFALISVVAAGISFVILTPILDKLFPTKGSEKEQESQKATPNKKEASSIREYVTTSPPHVEWQRKIQASKAVSANDFTKN